MTATIIDAIRNKTTLRIWYDPGDRLVEPHTLGRGADGQLLLRAYQVEGASSSGEHAHWKLFRVDRLRSTDANPAPSLAPRHGYKRGDSVMKRGIIAEI